MRHRLGILILAAAATASGCVVHQDDPTALTGPSGLAQTVRITATPDIINLGSSFGAPGQSSTISVRVFDESGSPVARVEVRLDIVVGSTIQDCGTLSSHSVQTGSDGVATATFTAPPLSPQSPGCFGFAPGSSITILATPIGTNFQASTTWSAQIRMVTPGMILPPADTPTPLFVFAPTNPLANTQVAFDGSSSCAGPQSTTTCAATSATITSYNWNFGDGATKTGAVVTHDFGVAQTYAVTLTVTNDQGRSASVTHFVTVGAPTPPAGPVAAFTSSPPSPSLAAGGVVSFDAGTSLTPSGAAIVNYRWNFGDGTAVVNTASATIAHTYTTVGAKTVTLIVTDANGLTASTTGTVTIVP